MKQHSFRKSDEMEKKRFLSFDEDRLPAHHTGFAGILRVAICCNRGTSAHTSSYSIWFCGSLFHSLGFVHPFSGSQRG